MDKINILVTGACGVTSRSVVRSLNKSLYFKDCCNFIGTDICYNRYGIFEGLYNKVYKVPSFNAPEYRKIMEHIIAENKIDYAVIIPEPEVLYWSEHPFDVKFSAIPPKFSKSVLSKASLYSLLKGTGLVPKFQVIPSNINEENITLDFPMWIRDYSEGTTSGMGSFMPKNFRQLTSWLSINEDVKTFMLSEFLPGRNLACFLLYDNGTLIKYGVAERQTYLMAKVAVSRITGNTNQGKLLNDIEPFEVARNAVEKIIEKTGETMNGLVVVDLKEAANGKPMVTEINIRHVAFTSSFANAGLNFSEIQFLILTNQRDKISPEMTLRFPDDNLILRDVDGLPIYIPHFREAIIGEPYIS